MAFISSDWSYTLPDDDGNPLPGGAGWYRCRLVANALREHEHDVVHCPHLARNKTTGEILPLDWNGSPREGYEIIVLQRWMHPEAAEVIRGARRFGQVIINDVDDWMDGLDPSNAAFENTHPRLGEMNREQARRTRTTVTFPANRNNYRESLGASSLLTVSTPYLADRYKRLGRPVVVLRNALDLERWRFAERSELSTVGWVGVTSHRSSDLEVTRGVLGPFIESNDLRFLHAGASSRTASAAPMLGIPDSRFRSIPQASILEYPSLFEDIDVGIAPLRDSPFNHAKSAIKAMEMAASGVPFIASDGPEYRWFGQGFLAKRPKDWTTGLKKMLDPIYRKERASAARERVEREDMAIRWAEWESVYDEAKP